MNLITWSDAYSVGVDELDRQHQQIIGLLAELAESLDSDHERETVSRVVNQIHSYIIEHFGLEERLLTNARYTDLAAHKAAHNRFITRFSYLCAEVDANRDEAISNLLAYLNDWWHNHILHEDMRYSELLRKR